MTLRQSTGSSTTLLTTTKLRADTSTTPSLTEGSKIRRQARRRKSSRIQKMNTHSWLSSIKVQSPRRSQRLTLTLWESSKMCLGSEISRESREIFLNRVRIPPAKESASGDLEVGKSWTRSKIWSLCQWIWLQEEFPRSWLRLSNRAFPKTLSKPLPRDSNVWNPRQTTRVSRWSTAPSPSKVKIYSFRS